MITEKFAKKLIFIGLVLFLGSISLFVYNRYVFDFDKAVDSDVLSHFGDFNSGVTGILWNLASVILFYVALKYTKDTYNLESEKYELSKITQKKIQFETTFFNLMSKHENILLILEYNEKNHNLKGRNFIKTLVDGILESSIESIDTTEHDSNEIINHIINRYRIIYNDIHGDIGHYLRNLYHFVKFIDESDIILEDKILYFRLLRSQLSNYELILLALNGLSEHGYKFKILIEKTGLLHNLYDYKYSKLYIESAYKKTSFDSYGEIHS